MFDANARLVPDAASAVLVTIVKAKQEIKIHTKW